MFVDHDDDRSYHPFFGYPLTTILEVALYAAPFAGTSTTVEIDVDNRGNQFGTDSWHFEGSVNDFGKMVVITVGALSCLWINRIIVSMVVF